MQHFDVIIIGGGASGLMCAWVAGQRGRRVLVLEAANKVGKKILMSGGGRCNFTNLEVTAEHCLSANPHFCKSALARYTQWDFIALAEKHRIAYHERKWGQLFCNDSAKQILTMLLSECEQAGVTLRTDCKVDKIEAESGFQLQTQQGWLHCQSLVIASGGLSIPKMGASGFGYQIAEQLGLQVLPRQAGLVPFMFSEPLKSLCGRLSGLSIDANLSTSARKRSFREQILFTHRGLSGPAVLQLSNDWQPGHSIYINTLPDVEILDWFREQKLSRPKALLRTALAQHLPKNFVLELETLWWRKQADQALAEWSDQLLEQIARQLRGWALKPSGTEGYRTAEVTLGGVDTAELSSTTMESKKQSGLYFIGEVVDVTGYLGGFNFQWAWSSGHAAGLVV